MPRRLTSGGPHRMPYRVVWTDEHGTPRRKAFEWQGPADRERDWLIKTGRRDARVIDVGHGES